MYFKKLELIGFKSFLNKTALDFEPGITAIVGPNGCGKSNIFDAIRWVLGEQSVKSLRGSQMQDVIFNGTDLKEPLGMAEVSLIFDNDKKFFDLDHDEVIVTRRIFRSGESEYLLNKSQVRLKDILELFMGTGIGSESYSLIEQGKIGMILSVKPEDRRLVFDEAAGITKYKTQKKEALRKLEDTEQNLLRLNDIVQEVKRQIGSLERQANKARRYKEIFEELKNKEVAAALLQKDKLSEERNGICAEIEKWQREEGRMHNLISQEESQADNRHNELKGLEDNILALKDQILNLDSLMSRSQERIHSDKERIWEIEKSRQYITEQAEQTRKRLGLDEEKLKSVKEEHAKINEKTETNKVLLVQKEEELKQIGSFIKAALESIACAKRNILELVSVIARVKNEIADSNNKHQVHLARKRRLEVERVKVGEEKTVIANDLGALTTELKKLEEDFTRLDTRITGVKNELQQENASLNNLNLDIGAQEREKLSLESHREFLEKLKTKYEDITDSMNAVIHLDKEPRDKISGLVVKINDAQGTRLSGEAKAFDLDTHRISQKIASLEEKIRILNDSKKVKEKRIEDLNKVINGLQEEVRKQEINLANKRTAHQGVLEQFNKINEESEIIDIELKEVEQELTFSEEKITNLQVKLCELENKHKDEENLISRQQENIGLNNDLKEKAMVAIAQIKTEIESLTNRFNSDRATLEILEDTYQQDKEAILNLEKQFQEAKVKQEAFNSEIGDLENKIKEATEEIEDKNKELKGIQDRYQAGARNVAQGNKKLEDTRKELDILKNKLYELQMQSKDVEFKILTVKERILQAYKVGLENMAESVQEADESVLLQDIETLKNKLDACGTVNLVAIEEYEELKKRYDFLTHQQNDLLCAKESLHEAIQKINRTTKKMFLDTFEKIKGEFRNYFKVLFNGGDAQIFLVDEQEPLESGIEIICRPPGKKLQNVLLLSGGEKSLSAIALIFAIFRIKPSPFCVLDEIDAALDEANVDRFSRVLQDFAKISQFIVITHNKKTIVSADVMYGITMEESGISKIVSVKFGQKESEADKDKDKDRELVGAPH